jgi:hypothetical protein
MHCDKDPGPDGLRAELSNSYSLLNLLTADGKEGYAPLQTSYLGMYLDNHTNCYHRCSQFGNLCSVLLKTRLCILSEVEGKNAEAQAGFRPE